MAKDPLLVSLCGLEVSPPKKKALHNLKCVGLKPPTGKSYEFPTNSPFVVDIFLLGTYQIMIKDDYGGLEVILDVCFPLHVTSL